MYMDSSCLARITVNKLRRVRMLGFSVETLSPDPQCMSVLFMEMFITQGPRRVVFALSTHYNELVNTAQTV